MNSKPFDRKNVERYIRNGYLIPDFMEKYDFSSIDDFRQNLIRVFSDSGKVDRMIQEMEKKAKKASKRQKKTANATINTVATTQETAFVPVQSSNLNVPYSCTEISSLVNGVIANPIENVKVNPVTLPKKKKNTATTKLDELKESLAAYRASLSEVESSIQAGYEQRARIVIDVAAAKERVIALSEQIKVEQKIIEDLSKEYSSCENKLAEDIELKQMTENEISMLEKEIRSLESKKLYFGKTFNDSYDYDSSKFEVSNEEVMTKMTELLSAEMFEDFAVSMLRKLSKILCVIEKVKAENDNIEVWFDNEEAGIVDAVRKMTEINIMVV